jgi:hypothetical protein
MSKRAMGALEFQQSRGGTVGSHMAIDVAKLVEAARKTLQGNLETDNMAIETAAAEFTFAFAPTNHLLNHWSAENLLGH